MTGRLAIWVGLLLPGSAAACSICAGYADQKPLRSDARQAKLVVQGRMSNPRLNAAGPDGLTRGGVTDLHVETVLKPAENIKVGGVLAIPRYVPVSATGPTRFVVLCDVVDGRLDPYRGVPVKSAAMTEFLRTGLALGDADPASVARWAFDYLDSADDAVAAEAFLELARTGDADIAVVAKQLDPAKLRKLLTDPKTPSERLGLFALLLGACGTDDDGRMMRDMIAAPTERTRPALSGLLAGLIALDEKAGWSATGAILGDAKRPIPERFAAITVLRYVHGSKSEPLNPRVLNGLALLLPQGDIADMAVEDLRRWQIWDLTDQVLSQFGKKSHDAPLMKRSIVRYALSCPRPTAKAFVNQLRASDPELVKDVEESLRYE